MNESHSLARVDLNLFRIFVTVAQRGSTGAAAEELHLTQSAVSHALGRLRQQLGEPVLVRQGRHLVLTPHGRAILPKVQQALTQLQGCMGQGEGFDPRHSDLTFRLGFRDILEAMVLPRWMQELEQMGSPLSFTSSRVRGNQMAQRLLAGELDVAVDLERPVAAGIESCHLRDEPLVLLLGPKHPAFGQESFSQADYQASHHVLVTLQAEERAFVDQRMTGLQGERRVRLHCETYFAAAQVVAHTQLLLTMPATYGTHLASLLGLEVRPLPFDCSPLPIGLYWRRSSSEQAGLVWLRERLQQALAN